MKKVMSVLMILSLIFSLSACSNASEESSSSGTQQTNNADTVSTEATDISSGETESKSLVVYFSRSGNTENVAKSIKSRTNSDIFEIIPAVPYSDDYDETADLAQTEKKNQARPAMSENIEDFQQYDVIYVGYPIWWGDMPMILYTFLTAMTCRARLSPLSAPAAAADCRALLKP